MKTTADKSYSWKVLGIVMIGTLMSALDSSIVNVSVPAIMADFGASVDEIEWIITGYMLAFAASMPLTAWLRDRMGHKALYVASLVVFVAGSVLCGLAWNLPSLIIARVIQAVGGGALTPTGMAMISESFEPHERGKALGYWGMGAIMGPAFGPTVGGYLTKYFGWPSIFLINLPIGLLGIYFALKILREDRPVGQSHRPFDVWGFAFLSIFLVSFLLGLTKGESEGWTSSYIVTCGVLALVGFVGFILVETQIPHKIIDLDLLKRPIFAACFTLTALRSVALYGVTFLLPLFLQNLKGLDEVDSGLLMLPGSLFMGVLMPIGGRLSGTVGTRYLAFGGFICLALSFFTFRDISVEMSTWAIIMPTLWRGMGVALLSAPLTATAMNAVPKAKAGMASSMLNLIQQVGGSVGIAILGMVIARRGTYHLSLLGSDLSPAADAYRDSLHGLARHAIEVGYAPADAARVAGSLVGAHVVKTSSVQAFQDAFLFGSLLVVLGIGAVLLLPTKPTGRPEEPHVME